MTICATLRDTRLNSDSGYVLTGLWSPTRPDLQAGTCQAQSWAQDVPIWLAGWVDQHGPCIVGNHWCSAGRRSGGQQSLLTYKSPLDTHPNMAWHLPLDFVTASCFPAWPHERYWCQKKHMKLSRVLHNHDKEKCHWVKTKCEVGIKGIVY